MHFVTGGAFNGKSKWVKTFYQLDQTPHQWISAYLEDEKTTSLNPEEVFQDSFIVLEGIELWIKNKFGQLDRDQIRDQWRCLIQSWLNWEKVNKKRKIIIIGTDISKGIVPIIEEERNWRDNTGWVYQDITQSAERMDLIWYGLNKKLK